MDCRSAQKNIALFVDGMLSEAKQRELLAHTESCASCRRELEDALCLKRAFESLPEVHPPEGLAQTALRKARKKKSVYVSVCTAAAAAVIALTIVLSSGVLPSRDITDAAVPQEAALESEEAFGAGMPVGEPEMGIMADENAAMAEEAPACEEADMLTLPSADAYKNQSGLTGRDSACYKPVTEPAGAELENVEVTDKAVTLVYRLKDGHEFVFEWLSTVEPDGLEDYLTGTYGDATEFEVNGWYYMLAEPDARQVFWEQDGIAFHATVPLSFTMIDIQTYCLAQMAEAQ